MNVAWAVEKLENFLGDLSPVIRGFREGSASAAMRGSLLQREPTIRRILAELGLPDTPFDLSLTHGRATARDNIERALGILRDEAEIQQNLGPTGPVIAAVDMHRVVWDAAAKLWDDKHFAAAVQRAATFLSAHVKDLTGRHDIQDVDLMRQTFSAEEPKADKPRLRWPGDPAALAVKSMNDGLRQLAPGIFMTIRNTSTHSTDELPEHEALEQLATLSLLARWIDSCDLVEAPKVRAPSLPIRSGTEIAGRNPGRP